MDDWIRAAIQEDAPAGDVTTESVLVGDPFSLMEWTAKSDLIVCGLFVGARVFRLIDEKCEVKTALPEGEAVEAGRLVLAIKGPARALLTGERVALNVVQHMSGVATLTRKYVDAAAGTGAKIAATRKTTPLMRRLEKYAVTVGGGAPHRFSLSDGVLIKDNHIAMAGGITEAVKRARDKAHHLLKIQVEVTSVEEGREAVEAGADLLLLDNMSTAAMSEAVAALKGKAVLEASGNMGLDRVREVAETGVDFISVGALTHSVIAADISARMKPE